MDNVTIQTQQNYKGKGALDAFLNLLSLVTLCWFSISFGGVLFQIINKFFAQPAFGYQARFNLRALQFNIASVLVVMPVFLIIIGILHQQYKKKKLNTQSGVYRWLTYLMLFAAICNIIGSLIALVYRLLEGDYAIGFLLKVATVLLIALGIFGYYYYDLKRNDYSQKSQISIIAFTTVIILAVAAIISGFIIAGSPAKSRMIKYDQERIRNLDEIKYQLENYYRENQKLPDDIDAARFERFNKDPETKQTYRYKVIIDNEFEICATFSLDSKEDIDYSYPGADEWYFHTAGEQCFETKVILDKDKPIIAPREVID